MADENSLMYLIYRITSSIYRILSYFSEIPSARTSRVAPPSYPRSPASRHRKCGQMRLRLDVGELEKSPSMRAPMRSEPLWLKLARRIPHPPVCCRPVRRARRRRRRPADPWRRPWCRPAQRPPGRRRSARRGPRFPSSSPRSPPTRRLPRPPRLRRRTP